jgi:hypothetical protein
MTILARRFAIICLAMAVFATGLTMVVQHSDRRGTANATGFTVSCPQAAGVHCRAAL